MRFYERRPVAPPPAPQRGKKRAGAILERLGDEEFRAQMQLTEDQVAALDDIASGRPPRNALAIIRAIELKSMYAYSRPPTRMEARVSLEQLLRDSVSVQGSDCHAEQIDTERVGGVDALEDCVEQELEQEQEERIIVARPPVIRRRSEKGEAGE
jgi:hypothetical protein